MPARCSRQSPSHREYKPFVFLRRSGKKRGSIMDHYIEKLVDLTEASANRIYNMSVAAARQRVLRGAPTAVREIEGSFALVTRHGKTVRLARSLDRPLRYFLAKRAEGPALIVADRIDAIHRWLTN